MKVTTETVATREVVLTIEPDPQTIDQAMRKAARQISRLRPVPGYRPGRAPYVMVERIFGRELILDEALNEVAPSIYRQAIEEAGVEPFERGQIEIESQDPLVLNVSVSLVPAVTVGDYATLSIEPEPEISISDAQIDEQIEDVQRHHAEHVPVERPVQLGDQIVVSLMGTSDGETVVDESNGLLDIHDGLAPPGFAEALVGMQSGETREFSLTYPEDFDDEDLSGRNVDFSVSVTTVRETHLPDLDDDLAKMAGDFETFDELRESVAERVKERLEREAREREAIAAAEALVERSQVDYPAAALEREIDSAIGRQKARLEQIGFTFEAYLRMLAKTEGELRDELRPEAEGQLVRRLVLTEYARAEGLSVAEEELAAEMQSLSTNIAASYGDRAPEVMERLRNRGVYYSLYGDALLRKAVEHLTARLTGRELAVEEETESSEAAVESGEPEAVESEGAVSSVESEDGEGRPDRDAVELETTAGEAEA